jgi:hypothetical protein
MPHFSNEPPGGHVPHPCHPILACADELRGTSGKTNANYTRLVSDWQRNPLVGTHTNHTDHSVITTERKPGIVMAEICGIAEKGAFQRWANSLAGLSIPDPGWAALVNRG